MGRSRVKGSLKRAVHDHPGEILTSSAAMRERRGRWAEALGEGAPLHLEVGMGRGRFLAELAARPEPVNYLGLELKPDRCVTARQKLLKQTRRPFTLLNAAAEILPQIFAPGELARIYLNFPDPWPSVVYRNRRLFGEGFLRVYQTLLAEGGELWFRSDQPACHAELLASLPRHLRVVEEGCDLHSRESALSQVRTEYERRYQAAGASIHFARLVKATTRIELVRSDD
ncbi:MAG: hypothetical protein Q8O14_06050 [bacterium]|nr:hypothetical protein [bacterium]